MLIGPETKISALIKANPEAIEAIASINSHFNKLRNPVLRKILASRVTIADAARIGGADISIFYEKLRPLGFELSKMPPVRSLAQPETQVCTPPCDLPENLEVLDVREALATGNDPFNEIMDALENLDPDQGLLLINTFEPTPLFDIVKKRGFKHFAEQKSPELVHTYLYRSPEMTEDVEPAKTQTKPAGIALSFSEALEKIQRQSTGSRRARNGNAPAHGYHSGNPAKTDRKGSLAGASPPGTAIFTAAAG